MLNAVVDKKDVLVLRHFHRADSSVDKTEMHYFDGAELKKISSADVARQFGNGLNENFKVRSLQLSYIGEDRPIHPLILEF